jgi:hypothetical protein
MSPDVVSVEVPGDATMPTVMTGRAAIRGKNEWWFENHTLHSANVQGPFPNGDRFAVVFEYEITAHVGPMAGKRMRMQEVALYTVGGGQVVREEFFYDMAGASNLPLSKPAAPKASAKVKSTARPKAKAKKARSAGKPKAAKKKKR